MLYSAGDISSLNAYPDAGLALDVAILRLSRGAGPNFAYNFGQSTAPQVGLNAKIGADVMLGSISFGASYIMALNIGSGIDIKTSSGLLGVHVLIWM